MSTSTVPRAATIRSTVSYHLLAVSYVTDARERLDAAAFEVDTRTFKLFRVAGDQNQMSASRSKLPRDHQPQSPRTANDHDGLFRQVDRASCAPRVPEHNCAPNQRQESTLSSGHSAVAARAIARLAQRSGQIGRHYGFSSSRSLSHRVFTAPLCPTRADFAMYPRTQIVQFMNAIR